MVNAPDKDEIGQNRDKTLQANKDGEITFRSTAVLGGPPKFSVQGDLAIAGNTRPIALDVWLEDGAGESRLTGRTTLTQTEFGVKPYSKLGALK